MLAKTYKIVTRGIAMYKVNGIFLMGKGNKTPIEIHTRIIFQYKNTPFPNPAIPQSGRTPL